jgi:hypothetical protein
MGLVYTFGFGKHEGKSVEQVAVDDFPYLVFARDNFPNPRFFLGKLPTDSGYVKKRIDDVIYKLDNFLPKAKCSKCDETAYFMSIIHETEKFKVDKDYSPPVKGTRCNVSVGDEFVYCKNHKVDYIAEKALTYEIKFSTLLMLPHKPKKIRLEVSDFLLRLTGFVGVKTKEALSEYISNLKDRNSLNATIAKKHEFEQLSLFPQEQKSAIYLD